MKFIFTAIALCIIFQLNAQSDFRSAYIVKNDNDTIYGLVNYKGNKLSAKKCVFKKNENSEKQTFLPSEIKSYRFDNSKYYVSRKVDVNGNQEQLFLEFLINGITDIYYYRDEKGEHYFLDNGNDLYELKNSTREVEVNDTRYLKESKEYIGILKATFGDSPTTLSKVDNVELKHKSLINIANQYHNEVCDDYECIIYEKKLPSTKGFFGIVAGYNGYSMTGTEEMVGLFNLPSTDLYDYELFPSVGFFYKKNLPLLNERLSFQYEGTFSRINLTSNESSINSNRIQTNIINLTRNAYHNSLLFNYDLNGKKIKPKFQFGVFSRHFFSNEYRRLQENLIDLRPVGEVIVTRSQVLSLNPHSKTEFGLTLGAGMKKINKKNKELYLDLRYQLGFSILAGLVTNHNTISINVGYQLGK